MRRVPAPFASLDPRGIVRQSTRIRIADDRTGRRAARIAHKLNEELEIFWHGLSHGQDAAQVNAYDAARAASASTTAIRPSCSSCRWNAASSG